MSGGKKFDQDKPRLDLLSSEAMVEIARVMTFGARKYGAQNWRQGIAWSRVFAAVQRHLLAWNNGETHDPETGISHLAHAGCGIMFLLEFAKSHPELDDRYKGDSREEEPFKSQEEVNDLVARATKVSSVQPEPNDSKAQRDPVPGLRMASSVLVPS